MRLTRLRLVNFRNHRRTELELAPGLTALLGANAQGKSSLLEAVQVAASGRSYRTPHDADLIRFDSEFARVAVAAERVDRAVEVDVALRRDAGGSGGVGMDLRVN